MALGSDQLVSAAIFGAFNILTRRGVYYGVPRLGIPATLNEHGSVESDGIVRAASIAEAKEKILQHYGSNHPRQWGAILIESFGAFNIVAWDGGFIGVQHETGPFDFAPTGDPSTLKGLVRGETVKEVKDSIVATYRGSVPHRWGLEDYLVDHAPPRDLDLPEVIEIEPIETCNLRCVMCHVPYMEMSK